MDDSEPKTISFKVSAEEADSIDTAARNNSLSRSDYIRKELLGGPKSSPMKDERPAGTRETTVLLHQILFVANRVYNTIFQMAEMAGAFSEAQLNAIGSKSHREGIGFLSTID